MVKNASFHIFVPTFLRHLSLFLRIVGRLLKSSWLSKSLPNLIIVRSLVSELHVLKLATSEVTFHIRTGTPSSTVSKTEPWPNTDVNLHRPAQSTRVCSLTKNRDV
jgi:hypothetical protein